MMKHKKLFLVFAMSIIGLQYFSSKTIQAEQDYEHGLTHNQSIIAANMSFVAAFLALGSISLLELHDTVQSYVDKLHSYVTEEEVRV